MEDSTLLDKTKWRLNGQKTLKDWAMKDVQINLHAFTQIQGGSYIQNKLSPQLRDEVLQKLQRRKRPDETKTEEEYISMKQSVLVLMNTMTKELDLDHLMSFYPAYFDFKNEFLKVLNMSSIAAKNIRHLKINIKNLDDCFNSDSTREDCIRFLSFLKELRILEIVGRSSNKVDFVLLCRELPNLRVLSAKVFTFDGSKLTEEEIRNSFGHLTMLEPGFLPWASQCQIRKVLPNLEIVPDIGGIGLALEDFVEDENIQLRERKCLNFDDYNWDLNVCPPLSNIRHLKLTCSEETWKRHEKTLNELTSLESLNLAFISEIELLNDILLNFGANLRWLSIKRCGVQLKHISEQCPKLEVLHLNRVNINGNSSQPANFIHLVELVLENAVWCVYFPLVF
ncbi:Hypothetical predicted protein [Cloeon dipterum]|uniref:Uncharacterized protein n=1 Tax=Cloeon dipterum TaxID=197152 RepID=A0A8S1E9I6_9INSE|nr:Hypothetical predicted protein [Cloeon dipterum]